MPLFDYRCEDCGKVNEILMHAASKTPNCSYCGSPKVKKPISAHSSLSGAPSIRMPGAGDTGCCGFQVHHSDCQGSGSCCGKSNWIVFTFM